MLSFLLLTALGRPLPPRPAVDPTVTVTVDSSRHEFTIRAGPFHLPDMGAMDHHAMDLGAAHSTPVFHFAWPVEGWFRGFRTAVVGGGGQALPRRLMHHMVVINYGRRQVLYPAAERLFGAGQETEDARLPATIGVPMTPGMDLGFYIAWHNDTGADLDGVYLAMTIEYLPRNQNPRPLDVFPLYMDVDLRVGGSNTFDLPPGRSERAYEFTLPVGGRIIGYGGHLHDYGRTVRLQDVASGRVLAQVRADADRAGRVRGVSRGLPGVRGAGVRLRAGSRYRVVGVYDNPTGTLLVNGGMAHLAALFAPDDVRALPRIDDRDPDYQRDLASLEIMGMGMRTGAGDGHDHAGMEPQQTP
ncbi:MAG: hypothetical protein IPI38_02985 [Gemmatimonadetes bacterium]|nr:hypothetical protein [Gemmatimonadota bacterium]MBK7924385.1 hypothetical protein [Gemmatimonadota bacterium]MBK9691369.1 hypothetical protein [Gemmatimonadota bacterium]